MDKEWAEGKLKLNLTDPCRTVPCQYHVEGCQASGLGHLLQFMREYIQYNAESPKQGKKRFNSIAKIFPIFLLFIYSMLRTMMEVSEYIYIIHTVVGGFAMLGYVSYVVF